jgi:hypothetical protein
MAKKRKNNATERERQAERMRAKRAAGRDLKIPKIANPNRRRRAERDIFLWLRTYFPDAFYRPFTDQQRQMVDDILKAARYGNDKAIAAPRSDGKTTIAECVILFCVITGLLQFPLIAAATGPDAARILDHIKGHLERNDTLAADYPEVCYPIRALEGAPQRAGSQTVGGHRTFLEWRQDHVVLPTIRRSRASGAVLMTRGLDSAIRGIRVGVRRPDFVLIDDPETRESVKSEEQTSTRRLTIEQDLAGLGGGDKKLGRVILTTIMRRATTEGGPTISFQYTDPQQKPSWEGRRFKLIDRFPDRQDLWDEYTSLRQADQQAGDRHARRAHEFYLEHREAMDAGAVLTNPERYSREILPDGSQAEVSAIERCFNIIADRGMEAFLTEYQNDPPEESGPIESGISATRIQRQLSGYPRKAIPPGCTILTQGIDVRKVALHWVVRAWRPDGSGMFTIDYGVQEVIGTTVGSDEGVDLAIRRAVWARMEAIKDDPYKTIDDQPARMALTLIDAGYKTDAIYQACGELQAAGFAIMPAMGFGKSAGCVQAGFSPPVHNTNDRKTGDGWFLSKRPGIVWLVCMETDRWKGWEHDRWLTQPGKPGCMQLFGESGDDPDRMNADEKAHFSYAKHLTGETEVEEVVRGALVRRWKSKSDTVHYFDASYMSDVAANMKGIRLLRLAKTAPSGSATKPVAPSMTDGRPFLISQRED